MKFEEYMEDFNDSNNYHKDIYCFGDKQHKEAIQIFKDHPEVAIYISRYHNDKGSWMFEYDEGFGVNYAYPECITINCKLIDYYDFEFVNMNLTEDEKWKILLLHLMEEGYKVWNGNESIFLEPEEETDINLYSESRILYNEYLKKYKLTNKNVSIGYNPKFKKILIIGNLDPDQYETLGYYICDAFERKGLEVIRCSTDHEYPLVWDYHILSEYGPIPENQKYNRYYSMSTIVNDCKPDMILVLQNGLALDFWGVTIPTYFYATKIAWRTLPLNLENFKGFFYAYLGAKALYQNSFKIEMNQIEKITFIPWGWQDKQYPNIENDRDIFLGFMGNYDLSYPIDDPEEDPINQHLYDDRNDVIKSLRNYNGFELRSKGTDREYKNFLSKCKIFLNVGCNPGHINQRMYHVIGSGAVLLQKWFKGIENLGFVHGITKEVCEDRFDKWRDYKINREGNCFIFKDTNELNYILKMLKSFPNWIEIIRKNGLEFIQDHKLSDRVKIIIKEMNR